MNKDNKNFLGAAVNLLAEPINKLGKQYPDYKKDIEKLYIKIKHLGKTNTSGVKKEHKELLDHLLDALNLTIFSEKSIDKIFENGPLGLIKGTESTKIIAESVPAFIFMTGATENEFKLAKNYFEKQKVENFKNAKWEDKVRHASLAKDMENEYKKHQERKAKADKKDTELREEVDELIKAAEKSGNKQKASFLRGIRDMVLND